MKSGRPFLPAWWLPGPHLQTVWGTITRSRARVLYRRETIETPDGDDLLLDHVGNAAPATPRLVLLHGLEGSSYSVYVQGLAERAARHGWNCTAINFRSCARDPRSIYQQLPNRRPRLYHSGETTDLGFVLETLVSRGMTNLHAFGASLGGNVLLKWLGENSGSRALRSAATISVPYDLLAGARHLESPAGLVYTGRFLRSLKRKSIDVARRFPELSGTIDVARVAAAKSFFEFDDAATAPLHGFEGAVDYYERSSSLRFISRISIPTLCISAENDPFLPTGILGEVENLASPTVQFLKTPGGGHMGFVSGSPWKSVYWAEDFIMSWFESQEE